LGGAACVRPRSARTCAATPPPKPTITATLKKGRATIKKKKKQFFLPQYAQPGSMIGGLDHVNRWSLHTRRQSSWRWNLSRRDPNFATRNPGRVRRRWSREIVEDLQRDGPRARPCTSFQKREKAIRSRAGPRPRLRIAGPRLNTCRRSTARFLATTLISRRNISPRFGPTPGSPIPEKRAVRGGSP